MSTGITTYTPIAIIRAGACSNCARDSQGRGIKTSVYAILGGAAVVLISIAMRESEYSGAGGLFGGLAFLSGTISLGKTAFSAKDSLRGLLAEQKKLDPSIVLMPKMEEGIDVERVEGTLSNRNNFRYEYIPEAFLLKPAGEMRREGLKTAALHTLRVWAQESGSPLL